MNDNISTGSETIDVNWFDENNLPELSLPRNTRKQIEMMFKYQRGEIKEPYFD